MKRELRRFETLLGGCRDVQIAGLPPEDDLEGQIRLEALVGLLEARGSRICFGAIARDKAAVWLGDGPLPAGNGPKVLWPRPPRRVAA